MHLQTAKISSIWDKKKNWRFPCNNSKRIWQYHFPLKFILWHRKLLIITVSIFYKERRRGALFFLRGQMCKSGSTFIKKIETFYLPLYYIILHQITTFKKDCKITALLMQTFDKAIDEPGTIQNKEFNCVVMLIIRLSNTSRF